LGLTGEAPYLGLSPIVDDVIVHHVEPVVNNVEFYFIATLALALLALFLGVGDTSKVQIEAP